MSLAAEADSAPRAQSGAKPVVAISVVTPKPDKFEEFMALQLAQQRRVRGQVKGLIGGRLFRSLDERSFVIVAMFESEEDAQAWREDERLIAHRAQVAPLTERAATGTYETVYEVGSI